MTKPVPNLSLRCWGVPKHLKMPPLTMIPILEQRASASSIECVVRITALVLSLAIWPTTRHINLRASGSIPADGSSSKIMGGLPTIASATESFLLFPPERVPASFSRCFYKSSCLIARLHSSVLLSTGIPLMRAKYSMFSSTDMYSKMGLVYGQ